jgi:hypothetical protein
MSFYIGAIPPGSHTYSSGDNVTVRSCKETTYRPASTGGSQMEVLSSNTLDITYADSIVVGMIGETDVDFKLPNGSLFTGQEITDVSSGVITFAGTPLSAHVGQTYTSGYFVIGAFENLAREIHHVVNADTQYDYAGSLQSWTAAPHLFFDDFIRNNSYGSTALQNFGIDFLADSIPANSHKVYPYRSILAAIPEMNGTSDLAGGESVDVTFGFTQEGLGFEYGADAEPVMGNVLEYSGDGIEYGTPRLFELENRAGVTEAAFELPMFELECSFGMTIEHELPMFELEATVDRQKQIDCEFLLPLFELDWSWKMDLVGAIGIELPLLDFVATLSREQVANGDVEFPLLDFEAGVVYDPKPEVTFTFPLFELEASIVTDADNLYIQNVEGGSNWGTS